MFKHFLVSALRHFIRHKVVTTINLLCLVIGITGFLGAHLVATFLDSADSYFPNAGRVFTINQTVEIKGSGIPTGTMTYTAWQAANYLRTDFPQGVVARTTMPEKISVLAGDTKQAMQVKYTEAEFSDLFALTFIAGDAKAALRQPHSVVLTEAAAQRLFGNSRSALGQRLVLENSVDVEVVGVIDNVKRPANLQAGEQDSFDMLVSMDVFERDALRQRSREDWTRLTV